MTSSPPETEGSKRWNQSTSTKLSYAADWSEFLGHHPQDSTGDVFFHLDPLWAFEDIDLVGIDNYMPLADRRDGLDHLDAVGCGRDHRPRLPAWQHRGRRGLRLVLCQRRRPRGQARTPITDGAPASQWVFRYKDIRRWWSNPHRNRPGGVERRNDRMGAGEQADPLHRDRLPGGRSRAEPAERFLRPEVGRKLPAVLLARLARRRGPARFLEAVLGYWGEPANNPLSGVYAGRMITTAETAAWTWDARPFRRSRPGRRLDRRRQLAARALANGRLGSVSLGAWCASSAAAPGCRRSDRRLGARRRRARLPDLALESPRASIAPLARQFGFDAIESEGMIRFQPRDRRPVATLGLDDLRSASAPDGEVIDSSARRRPSCRRR